MKPLNVEDRVRYVGSNPSFQDAQGCGLKGTVWEFEAEGTPDEKCMVRFDKFSYFGYLVPRRDLRRLVPKRRDRGDSPLAGLPAGTTPLIDTAPGRR
jgi:hypothetical protein